MWCVGGHHYTTLEPFFALKGVKYVSTIIILFPFSETRSFSLHCISEGNIAPVSSHLSDGTECYVEPVEVFDQYIVIFICNRVY